MMIETLAARAILMSRNSLRKPTNKLLEILAENLRTFRYAKGLSQEELAGLCGLHRTYIGSVERRERNVTLSTLETLANALEVTVPALLTKSKKEYERLT